MGSTGRKKALARWAAAGTWLQKLGMPRAGWPSVRGQVHPTSGDAVELPKGQVLHLVLLEAGRAGTVDGGHGGVGVCQPLHQPLHLAVTVEGIAPEVSGLGGRDTEGESLSCSAQ